MDAKHLFIGMPVAYKIGNSTYRMGTIEKYNPNSKTALVVSLDGGEVEATLDELFVMNINRLEKASTGKSRGDNVNHPKHYTSDKVECIDAMEQTFGTQAVISFCLCNAFKYNWRAELKNGEEDLAKARWYMKKAKELINKGECTMENNLKEKYTKEIISLKTKIGKLEAERDELIDEVLKLRGEKNGKR